ncbi:hypothetical protein DPMN_077986 [Dreissena polymorpha]|uniref:Uncharacterized protein n=1 Tax=Dreissena polymorpha TaxID=45954 RepID=A0A9D3YRM9_DREPO|nr:hypothetical protein DPMN_077986 [Dreissena polymorpha]
MRLCIPGGYQSSEAWAYAYPVDTSLVKHETMHTRWIPVQRSMRLCIPGGYQSSEA